MSLLRYSTNLKRAQERAEKPFILILSLLSSPGSNTQKQDTILLSNNKDLPPGSQGQNSIKDNYFHHLSPKDHEYIIKASPFLLLRCFHTTQLKASSGLHVLPLPGPIPSLRGLFSFVTRPQILTDHKNKWTDYPDIRFFKKRLSDKNCY